MASASPKARRSRQTNSFRIGKVRAYRRGQVWYLCYHENGRRRQPRVGPDIDKARQSASEINAQLEVGAPSALGFEPVTFPELRERWLDHHEHVRRSSVRTIERYRAATNHLLQFVAEIRPLRRVSDFRPSHAEQFVRHLRSLKVAPNGHENTPKRHLRDTSVKYILETCSTLLNYAQRHRHLPPYVENPFRTIEICRIPVEDAKLIEVFRHEEEQRFFQACDAWQFPLFMLLGLTGLRPGELTHLLLPGDLDLEAGWLHVRNKSALGWRIKTRNERNIPLHPVLVDVLRLLIGHRKAGPLFRRRQCFDRLLPPLHDATKEQLEREAARRIVQLEQVTASEVTRQQKLKAARTVWRDAGAIREEWVRIEFMRVTELIGLPHFTAPKSFRHTFATMLQDANVDPLVRNELMGHSPASAAGGSSLGMTGHYTHTRPATKRRQLEAALEGHPLLEFAQRWIAAAKTA